MEYQYVILQYGMDNLYTKSNGKHAQSKAIDGKNQGRVAKAPSYC